MSMNIFKNLAKRLRRKSNSPHTGSQTKAPSDQSADNAHGCPVCWGYQEYDHKVREKYKDKQIDIKNHKDTHLKSRRFQVRNIDGIRYKKASVKECPECGRNLETKD